MLNSNLSCVNKGVQEFPQKFWGKKQWGKCTARRKCITIAHEYTFSKCGANQPLCPLINVLNYYLRDYPKNIFL